MGRGQLCHLPWTLPPITAVFLNSDEERVRSHQTAQHPGRRLRGKRRLVPPTRRGTGQGKGPQDGPDRVGVGEGPSATPPGGGPSDGHSPRSRRSKLV